MTAYYAVMTPAYVQVHATTRGATVTACGAPVALVIDPLTLFMTIPVADRCPWCHTIMWTPGAAGGTSGWVP